VKVGIINILNYISVFISRQMRFAVLFLK